MNYSSFNLILLSAIIYSFGAIAQPVPGNAQPKSYIPWAPIKDENILWSKKVWRIINLMEASNAPLRTDTLIGEKDFPNAVLKGIKEGVIKAYADEQLTDLLSNARLDTAIECIANMPCNYPKQITHYGVKEHWIFDKGAGLMVVHIIALSPLALKDGKYTSLFWLSYPDARSLFSQYEIHSPNKAIKGLTWDEYFETRSFSSKITKVDDPNTIHLKRGKNHTLERITEEDEVPTVWPVD